MKKYVILYTEMFKCTVLCNETLTTHADEKKMKYINSKHWSISLTLHYIISAKDSYY